MVLGPGPGSGAANSCSRSRGCGHERRVEFAGLYAGSMVESNPGCGVVLDGDHGNLRQCDGWFRR